ncbi:MAG: hypothetical protein O2809_04970 [Proteobacteria bacterium]|nr:hypothetical protein [Pseudomonadota bacterium]
MEAEKLQQQKRMLDTLHHQLTMKKAQNEMILQKKQQQLQSLHDELIRLQQQMHTEAKNNNSCEVDLLSLMRAQQYIYQQQYSQIEQQQAQINLTLQAQQILLERQLTLAQKCHIYQQKIIQLQDDLHKIAQKQAWAQLDEQSMYKVVAS